jgi:hypothetical protein
MKANVRRYSIVAAIVAALFIFSMAAPVIADEYATFTGKIAKSGQFTTPKGKTYWLIGKDAAEITKNINKGVEIKGLERGKQELGDQYKGPTIEVYSYKWLESKPKKT